MKISIEGIPKDEDLASTLCIFPINVGQDYYRKELFSQILEQLFKKGFRHFLVVVADTLQRHTLALSQQAATSESIFSSAKLAGDQWREETREVFDNFARKSEREKSLRVLDWEAWRTQSIFQDQLTQIRERYSRDVNFHSAVDRVVTRFVHGFATAHPDISFDRERAARFSEEYILEEAAVVSIWADKNNIHPELNGYQHLYMAYPFGNHPTNNAIYNYLKEIINESNFRLINVHIKTQNAQKSRYKPDINNTMPAEGTLLSEEDESQLKIVQATMFGGLHAVLASNTLSRAALLALAQKMLNEAQKIQLENVSLLTLKDEQRSNDQTHLSSTIQQTTFYNHPIQNAQIPLEEKKLSQPSLFVAAEISCTSNNP